MEKLQRALASLHHKKKDGEKGFSLIELIVVVAILGILVAIAIPVFNGLQDRALTNSVKSAASNAATQAASQIAAGDTPTLPATSDEFSYAWHTAAPTTVDGVCVTATSVKDGTKTSSRGPGCP